MDKERVLRVLEDLDKVVDQLMPGIGGLVVDIGHLNDTLIEASKLRKELREDLERGS